MAECILVGNGGGGGYELTMTSNGKFQYPANVVIPANVTSLGAGNSEGGFYNHTEIENVTFEDANNITALSNDVFNGCTSLQSFDIPAGVTSINNNAFRGCIALASVTIPANVTSIGTYAFYGCPLTNITWETADRSVTYGNYAFSHSGITDTGITQALAKGTSFGTYLFEYCDNLVNVTARVPWNYMFQYCLGLKSIDLKDSNSHSTGTYVCRGCIALETVAISSGIETIGTYAFDGCGALESVTIADTVTNIGSYAFRNCTSLQTITLPSSITSINANSFTGCTSLTNIVLGEGWDCACSFSAVTTLTEASLVGILNSLADLTSSSAKTLTLGSTNLNKLTAEEKLVALNKNWNLA